MVRKKLSLTVLALSALFSNAVLALEDITIVEQTLHENQEIEVCYTNTASPNQSFTIDIEDDPLGGVPLIDALTVQTNANGVGCGVWTVPTYADHGWVGEAVFIEPVSAQEHHRFIDGDY